MAQGHITAATKIDLTLQPIRAVLIVLIVFIFKTQESFAIALLILTFVSLPYQYYVKSTVQTNDYKSLLHALKKSMALTFFCCIPPTIIFFFAPRLDSIVTVPYLVLSAFLCAIFWTYGLFLIKHPLASDPVFRRQIERIPLIKALISRLY